MSQEFANRLQLAFADGVGMVVLRAFQNAVAAQIRAACDWLVRARRGAFHKRCRQIKVGIDFGYHLNLPWPAKKANLKIIAAQVRPEHVPPLKSE